MRRGSRLGLLVGLLVWAGTAEAGAWRAYVSLGAGMALDHLSDWDARGAAINGYFGIEAPVGLSLGLYGEAAETWGRKLEEIQQNPTGRVQLDYRQYGLEVRLRLLRDRLFSPWVAVRLARSRSQPLTPDEFGELVRREFKATSGAVRFGIDWWLGEQWGATAATSWQWCDVKYETQQLQECARPINTILVGPTVRF